jgi:hypothetical protein
MWYVRALVKPVRPLRSRQTPVDGAATNKCVMGSIRLDDKANHQAN